MAARSHRATSRWRLAEAPSRKPSRNAREGSRWRNARVPRAQAECRSCVTEDDNGGRSRRGRRRQLACTARRADGASPRRRAESPRTQRGRARPGGTPEFLALKQNAVRVSQRTTTAAVLVEDDGGRSLAPRGEQMAPRRGAEQKALAHRAGGLALEERPSSSRSSRMTFVRHR